MVVFLMLIVLSLSPGSVIVASVQVQMTDVKVLENSDSWNLFLPRQSKLSCPLWKKIANVFSPSRAAGDNSES